MGSLDTRAQAISGYERQLDPEPTNMWFGLDVVGSWASSKIDMLAAYKSPLAPTAGQRVGGRGEIIDWNVPRVVARQTRWSVRDYTVDTVDQLMEWQAGASELAGPDQLRAWSFGMFWLRCKILDVTFGRPFKKKLEFVTLNQGLYYYKPLSASLPLYNADQWDELTVSQPTQNNPFLSVTNYGRLYGDGA